jgi:hypothetical protein
MNDYTTKEKLAALTLLGMARQSVAMYAQPQDQSTATESALTLAAEYARTGADLSVLKVLTYPAPKEDVKC